MARFKVGDLVKVVSERPGGRTEYVDSMVEYLGKTTKVSAAYEDQKTYNLEDAKSDFGFHWVFAEDWLMPAFKFEIGENVKVGDAIGHITNQYKSDGENCYLVQFENVAYSYYLGRGINFSACYRESQVEKYEPELPTVKEETKPEPKKRNPLEVFAMLNEYFDWFWDVDKFDLVVGIREGTTDDEESSQPYKRKEFGLDETKQAYKWLVKRALKLDAKHERADFTEWYNGQD